MKSKYLTFGMLVALGVFCLGHSAIAEDEAESAIRQRLADYVAAFNSNDASAVASFWTEDGVSVAGETGERTQGRDVLQKEFETFFGENADARLSGEVNLVRMVRPDIAEVEGTTTLFVSDAEPVQSSFTAILVKEGDDWLISSSHEQDAPQPATPYDALKELEWLVGTWQDQTDDAQIVTTVRWSANRAFLIRSFEARFGDRGISQGTQVIGWDPLSQQIRSWSFHSDGSFGQGTISRHDNEWMMKMTQILSDGSVATATKIVTRVNDDTISMQTIGETLNGEPVPPLETVVVNRMSAPPTDSDLETSR